MEGLGAQAQAMTPAAMPPGQKRKFTILLILKNLGKVAFMFGFVYVFTLLFDESNAIIGITIASAILMFMNVDIGIKPVQASFLIFYLFLHIGFFSYLLAESLLRNPDQPGGHLLYPHPIRSAAPSQILFSISDWLRICGGRSRQWSRFWLSDVRLGCGRCNYCHCLLYFPS